MTDNKDRNVDVKTKAREATAKRFKIDMKEPTPGSIRYARILRKQLDLQTTMLRHILANIKAGKAL